MTKKQLDQFEKEKAEMKRKNEAQRRFRQEELAPEFKTAGLILGKTPEERKAYFDKLRRAVDEIREPGEELP